MSAPGISFVVPVCNGERHLDEVLGAIADQCRGREAEIIAIDDGGSDGSASILEQWRASAGIRVLEGAGAGVAGALNLGVEASAHAIICQVDQDVVIHDGWVANLVAALGDPEVAAAQGYYETSRSAPILARIAGYDLELRWTGIDGGTDHVSSGNTAYRKGDLLDVGGFDESLGYGADNDLSYRLLARGRRLILCRSARSTHHWRTGLGAYLMQQYGVGYGRLDVIRRHPSRCRGDRTSGLAMIAHVPATMVVVAALSLGAFSPLLLRIGAGGLTLILAERSIAGLRAALRFRDPAPLLFPIVHLLRNISWCWASVRWAAVRLLGRADDPGHSMSRDS